MKASTRQTAQKFLTVALLPYVMWLVFFYQYHFIDGVNLLFHEAGHLFLGFFGETLHFLGGSIGQMMFPVACIVSFWRRKNFFAAWFCVLWGGESLMYMAEYMGDAIEMKLPLVGGGIHDWNWLFSRAGWLHNSKGIALFVHIMASIIVITALVKMFIHSRKDVQQ